MPFQSEKQRRYLHANHPEIAKRWERDYAGGGIAELNTQLNSLPEYYMPFPAAQGGRIGYNRGRVVNPGGYAGIQGLDPNALTRDSLQLKMIEDHLRKKRRQELLEENLPELQKMIPDRGDIERFMPEGFLEELRAQG